MNGTLCISESETHFFDSRLSFKHHLKQEIRIHKYRHSKCFRAIGINLTKYLHGDKCTKKLDCSICFLQNSFAHSHVKLATNLKGLLRALGKFHFHGFKCHK